MYTSEMDKGDAVADIVKGVIAGALATLVMGQVTSFMWTHEDPAARQKYQQVTGGQYVPERSAEKAEDLTGLDLDKQQEQELAKGMHWGVGLGAGVTYALLRRAVPGADRGHGLLFGLAFWALFDEGATVLAGLAKPPQAYPWQAHARGLAGHLVYGTLADTTLNLLDRAA